MQGLTCCLLRYCLGCISQWAEIESSCPLCKARFTKISHRLVVQGANTRSRKDTTERLGPVVHVHEVPERHQVDAAAISSLQQMPSAAWLEAVFLAQRVEDTGTPGEFDPLEDAICVICQNPNDEDQTLLCDGEPGPRMRLTRPARRSC